MAENYFYLSFQNLLEISTKSFQNNLKIIVIKFILNDHKNCSLLKKKLF